MALITCKECGREVSDKAHACPGCGAPIAPAPPPAPHVPPPAQQVIVQRGTGCGSLLLYAMILGVLGLILLVAIGSGDERRYSAPRSATTAAPSMQRWELVGQQGDMRFVFIPAAHSDSKSEYHMAVGSLCAGKTHCYVNFWQDRAKTPSSLPLTDEQVAAQVAGYIMNTARGKSHWAWKCDKFPDTDPAHCF